MIMRLIWMLLYPKLLTEAALRSPLVVDYVLAIRGSFFAISSQSWLFFFFFVAFCPNQKRLGVSFNLLFGPTFGHKSWYYIASVEASLQWSGFDEMFRIGTLPEFSKQQVNTENHSLRSNWKRLTIDVFFFVLVASLSTLDAHQVNGGSQVHWIIELTFHRGVVRSSIKEV